MKKIMIVDDEPDQIFAAKIALEQNGEYEVIGANNGKHCFELLEDGQIPDLILLDLMMPKMTGWTVHDRLKKKKIKKPLVAWCIGTCSKVFPVEVQFGHAGARAGAARETSDAKNKALKEAGAIVPSSFEDFDKKIKQTFDKEVKAGGIKPRPDDEPPKIPID